MTARCLFVSAAALSCACATTGSGWMAEPWDPSHPTKDEDDQSAPTAQRRTMPQRRTLESHSLGVRGAGIGNGMLGGSNGDADELPSKLSDSQAVPKRATRMDGKVAGTFKNTYYDFPSESDYSGDPVPLYDAQCKSRASVPKGFFETLCVQGSGLLASGSSVSFNRRDCDCAPVCPRTGQKICFDVLDMSKYPWGRGATGQPITPLLTVAVDSKVLPLGTSLYIPEFDGMPRDPARRTKHDGCFVAQDRGLRVQGQHVDIFTGQSAMTRLWNSLVPSNSGVTVVLDSPHCSRAN
jgi:3D (Asp-Asp-Asp) domain-containing protein